MKNKLFYSCALAFLVSACAANINSDHYTTSSTGSVGQVMRFIKQKGIIAAVGEIASDVYLRIKQIVEVANYNITKFRICQKNFIRTYRKLPRHASCIFKCCNSQPLGIQHKRGIRKLVEFSVFAKLPPTLAYKLHFAGAFF